MGSGGQASRFCFIYLFFVYHAKSFILSLSILHPVSFSVIRPWGEWQMSHRGPTLKMCGSEERTLDLDSHHAL